MHYTTSKKCRCERKFYEIYEAWGDNVKHNRIHAIPTVVNIYTYFLKQRIQAWSFFLVLNILVIIETEKNIVSILVFYLVKTKKKD